MYPDESDGRGVDVVYDSVGVDTFDKSLDCLRPRVAGRPLERVRLNSPFLLRSVEPEKLWLSADCGYSQTARPLAVDKMRSLVSGARTLREELSA